jgi:choline kinase
MPKPLLHIKAEQSILEYTLLSMNKTGLFKKVIIVTGYMHSAMRSMIRGLAPRINFEIQDVVNPQYASKSVLYSVEAGLHAVGEGDILLMNGDTLFSVSVFDEMKQALLRRGMPKGAVIGSMKSEFDSDDIRVQFDDVNGIVHIGKNLKQAGAVSCGIILISSSLRAYYAAKLNELKRLDKVIHHDIIEGLCRDGVPIAFMPVPLRDWLEIDAIEDLHFARKGFGGGI